MRGYKKEIDFWRTNKSWYTIDNDTGLYCLTKDAPREAIASFKAYIEYRKNRGEFCGKCPYDSYLASLK